MVPNHPDQENSPRTAIGAEPVGVLGAFLLTVLIGAIALLTLYGLWRFWPAAVPVTGASPPTAKFSYFGWRVTLTRDQQFFVLAAFAGATGAAVHSLRSLSAYIGARFLFRSWIAYYALLPIVGALIATLVYLVLRAGLLPGAGTSSQPDPYGVAAICGLVGLSSRQAAEKLIAVFETLFTKTSSDSEPITDALKPEITTFNPSAGPVGASVKITGSNLRAVTAVVFTNADATQYAIDSDTQITVTVPANATSGPLTLRAGQEQVKSGTDFTVTP